MALSPLVRETVLKSGGCWVRENPSRYGLFESKRETRQCRQRGKCRQLGVGGRPQINVGGFSGGWVKKKSSWIQVLTLIAHRGGVARGGEELGGNV